MSSIKSSPLSGEQTALHRAWPEETRTSIRDDAVPNLVSAWIENASIDVGSE